MIVYFLVQIKKPIQFKFENENENENEKQIKQISTGNFSTIFLFKNGKAIEYSNEDDLNQNTEKIQIENIQKVTVEFINISSLIEDKNDRIIQDVVSGHSSIYLLTSNQNVYGIGSNKYGQLGFDSETLKETEKPILMMKNVSKIFSGNSSYHVFLLNSNQELFGCGNNSGQLGLGKSRRKETKIKKLTKIQNIPKGKIIDIQCGYAYSIMMIENENQNPKRKLYSCGYWNLLKSNHLYLKMMIIFLIFLFNEDISNYHISCGGFKSFLYYSPSFSNLEEDLIKLFERKEFCNISFKTENGEIIKAHKLILKYRLNQNQNEIEKLQEIISKKSIKESNQIFEMIYSNRIINPKLYSEIKEIINSNEKIEETMKRIYLNENENENEKDFIIERKEKQYKFPKININNEK
ncbi:claret isoform a [Anaeramoeba ignava]|uniref:Claret isoform a n=1 Tax=Anaeramoeba ignava TaxID=1746090 RepID=A0A9Q0RBY7_ANAIG|nr:claret isoform a [Anaeramoeba ignava]